MKLWLIKIPITPKSTSIYIDKNFKISVVSKEISRYSKIPCVLRVLIVEYYKSLFFYLEYQIVHRFST